ncbi:MAG: hypothetical protein CTY30_09125, partial [Methylocystis sp.]
TPRRRKTPSTSRMENSRPLSGHRREALSGTNGGAVFLLALGIYMMMLGAIRASRIVPLDHRADSSMFA